MSYKKYNSDIATKLMLVQGISLIEDGMQFLEWAGKLPNENSWDALSILRDRFTFFKDCVFEENNCDNLIIDRISNKTDYVQYCYELQSKIKNELQELKIQAIKEREELEKKAEENSK